MLVEGRKKVVLILGACLLNASTLCAGGPFMGPGDTFGFELGNGKSYFTNRTGSYRIVVNQGWDVSTMGAFTEILAPLLENHLRSRLQINVAKAPEIGRWEDLVRRFTFKSGWTLGKIGRYPSIQKEAQVKEDRCMFDARILKSPGEVTMIQVDGGPDCAAGSDFERVKSSLETFTLME